MDFLPEAITNAAATWRATHTLSTRYHNRTRTYAYLRVSADLKWPLLISLIIVRFGGIMRFGDEDGDAVSQVIEIELLLLLWFNVRLGDSDSGVVVVCVTVDEEGGLMLYKCH